MLLKLCVFKVLFFVSCLLLYKAFRIDFLTACLYDHFQMRLCNFETKKEPVAPMFYRKAVIGVL
jgi:hypothetical protein